MPSDYTPKRPNSTGGRQLRPTKRSAAAPAHPLLEGAVTAHTTADVQRIAGAINAEHALAQEEFLKHAIRCGELLLEQKQRVGYGNFGKWIEAHCEFSVASANNYMKVAKNPNALGKSGAIRRLYPSGFMDATKKTTSKEKTVAAVDVKTITETVRKASIGSTTATARLISQKERETATDAEIVTNRVGALEMPEVTIDVAVNVIKAAVKAGQMAPECILRLVSARATATRSRHNMEWAERKLAGAEQQVMKAYREYKAQGTLE